MSGIWQASLNALGLAPAWGWLSHWPPALPVLGQPAWLLLLVLPLLPALWRWRRRQRVLGYADEHLRPWAMQQRDTAGRGGRWRRWALGLFWLLLVLAMADPQVPRTAAEPIRPPAPVMIVLDGSAAMSVTDVSPDRLGRARQLIGLLADKLPGTPIGLMLYSDRAGLLLPPSKDRHLLQYFSGQTSRLLTPTRAPRPDLAFDRTRQLAAMRHGTIVWLTSGDQRSFAGTLGPKQLAAAKALKAADIPVLALVEGRRAGMMRWHDQPVTDDQGRVLQSKPSLARVREVAQASGGAARQTTSLPQDAAFLVKRLRQRPGLPAAASGAQTRSIHQLPLLLALVCLLLAWWPARVRAGGGRALAGVLLPLAVLGTGLWPGQPLQAAPVDEASADPAAVADPQRQNRAQSRRGERALASGDYVTAQTDFAAARGYAARLGAGIAAYRRADYAFAVDQLQQALWLARQDRQRALVLFDLGDALVMVGRYQAALDAFNAVLALQPDNAGARKNRNIVAKLVQQNLKNQQESPRYQGHQAAIYGYYHEPKHSKMPDELLKSEGVVSGGTPGSSASEAPAKPFRLTPQMATSARRKLDLVHDQPAPLLRGLLEQQIYGDATDEPGKDGGAP